MRGNQGNQTTFVLAVRLLSQGRLFLALVLGRFAPVLLFLTLALVDLLLLAVASNLAAFVLLAI